MAIATPGSVNSQSGSGGPNTKSGASKGGGKNQGKVAGTGRRYSAHPRKRGQ